jgi:hypothetical protein
MTHWQGVVIIAMICVVIIALKEMYPSDKEDDE